MSTTTEADVTAWRRERLAAAGSGANSPRSCRTAAGTTCTDWSSWSSAAARPSWPRGSSHLWTAKSTRA